MRNWLRDMRKKSGFTMKDMSHKLNISESYYCAIESGDRQKNMDVFLASQLAVIFKIPVSKVVACEKEMQNRL